EVGQGLRDPETMPDILAARDRAAAGKTAPPHGLILWSVAYGDDDAHESVDFAPIF
ncbi:MAG: tRNA pseudouridine(38-40) synthase TruA, partial [Calditerricola sp.]|nr:tRNA pseudouridine(38-40) synthase TruA [Calditerricola sp.]